MLVNTGRAHFGLIAVAALGLSQTARAEEPRRVTEPEVMREPVDIMQVVDAFDGEDPFDLHLSLGFDHQSKSAKIRRETSSTGPSLSGSYTSSALDVADYKETTRRLLTRADIGIYKDIALVLKMPVILSNKRSLSGTEHSDTLKGEPGEGPLFNLDFNAPTRSGIEHLSVGLDFGILNQYRDPTSPTWIFGIAGNFNVSTPMHACNKKPGAGQVKCADPSDMDRDGSNDGDHVDSEAGNLEGSFNGGREPGVSRGVTGLELHSYMSKRLKYVEPYGGIRALFEFQTSDSDYGATDLKGSLVNHPPLRGTVVMGMAVIPWEMRDAFQRVTLDFRFEGTYVSEGRDYSELFDALGSSDSPSLRRPHFAEFEAGPNNSSVADPSSRKVYFTGLTDVQQHGSYTFSTQFTWQAGRYIKFNLGGALNLTQSHFITFDQACNPDFKSNPDKAGPCKKGGSGTATGIPNPNFRRVINDPGRRFKADDVVGLGGWFNATVMF